MILRSNLLIKLLEQLFGEGIQAIALFPFIIMPTSTLITDKLINHERIHLQQQIEMLVIPFYIWYLIAFFKKGYREISFEKEAYAHENDLTYLRKRKLWSFLKYL